MRFLFQEKVYFLNCAGWVLLKIIGPQMNLPIFRSMNVTNFELPNLHLDFESIDCTKGSGKSATMALLVHQLAEAGEIRCESIGYDFGSFGNSSDDYSDPYFFWWLKKYRTNLD